MTAALDPWPSNDEIFACIGMALGADMLPVMEALQRRGDRMKRESVDRNAALAEEDPRSKDRYDRYP